MKKIILIIEDERKLVRVLSEQLLKEDLDVKVAFDGKEAMEICRKQKPDFILLDLLLPVMSGIDFLRQLRKEEGLKDIPVLVLTNLTDDKIMIEAKNLGVINYLIKSDIRLSYVSDIIKFFLKNLNER